MSQTYISFAPMTNNSIPAKYLTRKFQRICVRSILIILTRYLAGIELYLTRKFQRICVRSILIILTGLNFCLRAQAAETDEATRLQKLEQAVLELQQENKSLKQEVSALKARPSTSLSPKAAVETNAVINIPARSDFKSTPIDLTENGLVTSPPGKSPLALQIGSVTFTPLGFMDFTSVTRGTLNGGDIGTSFASFPSSNTASGQLSETRFSAKNSRLGLRM